MDYVYIVLAFIEQMVFRSMLDHARGKYDLTFKCALLARSGVMVIRSHSKVSSGAHR